jgi:hypothetical protein
MWRSRTQIGLFAWMIGICLSAPACGDSICRQGVDAYYDRREECYGNYDLTRPDEVECPPREEEHFKCLKDCYSLPCDTSADEVNACLDGCPP